MSRIYITHNSAGNEVGLFLRPHNATMPYVVTVNGRITAEIDFLGDAYRLYNEIAK